jgi:asparagine synthetase B (glutamine-hydrolysing)
VDKAAEIGFVIRKRVRATLAPLKGENFFVALSGGVDSTSILAACLELGIRPHVISLTPDSHESTDFKMARVTAQQTGCRFSQVLFPTRPDAVDAQVREVIGWGYEKKTQVECLTAMMPVVRCAAQQKNAVLLTGDQSDGYWALNRRSLRNVARSLGDKMNIDEAEGEFQQRIVDVFRERYWDNDQSMAEGIQVVGKRFGLRVVVPYRDRAIYDAVAGSSLNEVNLPRNKEPIHRAFGGAMQGMRFRPVPVSIHKGDSQIEDIIDAAMRTKNPGYRSAISLYRAIARGEA